MVWEWGLVVRYTLHIPRGSVLSVYPHVVVEAVPSEPVGDVAR